MGCLVCVVFMGVLIVCNLYIDAIFSMKSFLHSSLYRMSGEFPYMTVIANKLPEWFTMYECYCTGSNSQWDVW